MATAAVIGISTGKRLLSTSFCPSDLGDKFLHIQEHGLGQFISPSSTKSVIVAKKSSQFGPNLPANRHLQAIQAIREHVDSSALSTMETCLHNSSVVESGNFDLDSSLEAFILLQKSMLEKQWELSFNHMKTVVVPDESCEKNEVVRSGVSARERRMSSRGNILNRNAQTVPLSKRKQVGTRISPEFMERRVNGYVRGTISENLLTHAEVVNLSKKIKAGLSLEEHKKKLAEKLGLEPSIKQLASSLKMPRTELQTKLIECSLAQEKLAMSNVRLVISIAQKYDHLGADMADLVQGGLIGLLRGIEKFDSSKGFRISTYVYWWIRQKIAESLNMSKKKVRNATEAVSKILSLDRDAFPSLNGLPGETLHSYIADNKLENNPWHGFEEWSIKDEVNKLLHSVLGERERDIIGLYYGLSTECHTWEDISRKFGLSRERVRQVGLVALEKLKLAARKRQLDAMLIKQ
ncbi:Sigma3 and sigma4 domains of RNA polymerase sigma factors protein [Dioscorea alata]|uniref:Sigma3 and sigma4 domains of RNA polymerase sigma factors protein n=1 Tax=Dioscorea alata TaxID=55571 RepID=A0ACB7V5U9_DIOAL|nr:Sigma3 and sigma4 domains of RNA polymerase sigma factors protein [Dioscorea alata]